MRPFWNKIRLSGIATALLLGIGVAGCGGGDFSPQEEAEGPGRAGPQRELDLNEEGLFGPGGATIGSLRSGLIGGNTAGAGALPVNRFLWQASLDTLSFLPLGSTDPFTGVITTDWGSTPEAPGERFKVTAFVTSPILAASSLRVAVYREARNADGLWVPAPVDPQTAVRIEDAILTRARQIRIAAAEAEDG